MMRRVARAAEDPRDASRAATLEGRRQARAAVRASIGLIACITCKAHAAETSFFLQNVQNIVQKRGKT